jgi:EAL domain-containing protein (putative c-di-GMP-specific phosphodiesterase class I)/FixJ family two-component response regulator
MTQANRILIVDDEPAVAQLLGVLLSAHGYKAEIVDTGKEALARANSNTDLILLDTLLPDCDGFKICHLLKNNSRTKHIPIIVISGRIGNSDRLESFHLGADDYLTKPFEPEELFARVEAVLYRNRIHHRDDPPNHSYEIIHELRQIIDQESIAAYFQPIYFLKPLRLFGLEVLSRPQTNGLLSNPEDLFKAALRFGLYYELEMIVWRKAIEIARRNFDHEHLFLNCSPYLIESDRFENVKAMFQDFNMGATNVFLELTERSAIGEHQLFFDRLSRYRQYGFKIAIDDVGAGYATLEAIIKTRPEIVKIDRKIVTGLGEDPFKKSIVKLIIAFCRENAIICIAEGIETKEDFQTLVELGVQAGQGYFLYKPTGHIDLKAMGGITV